MIQVGRFQNRERNNYEKPTRKTFLKTDAAVGLRKFGLVGDMPCAKALEDALSLGTRN